MKSKLLLSCIGATALLATSCVSDDVVQNNPDPKGNALTFVPSVGSRAVETNLGNLGDIGIFARALHNNYSFYDNFLIGSESGSTFLPEIAHKRSPIPEGATEGNWELSRNVYWPTGVKAVLFWGVTTLQGPADATGVMNGNGTFSFGIVGPNNESGMKLTGFSPIQAERPTAGTENPNYSDGELQQDLVIAHQAQSTQSSHIKLNFKHKLAQIQILATRGNKDENDHRIVKVKGAWIVNVKPTGDFISYFKHDNAGKISFTDELDPKGKEWYLNGTPVAYGSLLEDAYTLKDNTEEPTKLLDNKPENTSEHGSLMLIPQTAEKWNGGQTNSGAYILLYCRVELEHSEPTHDGGTTTSDKTILTIGNMHYHQLFPEIPTDGKFEEDAYGYTCVPIDINWEAGKRYTYTLTVCGPSAGAGVYPPVNPEFGITYPDESKIGKPVLDDPISFTVSVDEWPEEWTPGN